LPVRTGNELNTIVTKLINYTPSQTGKVVLVADQNDKVDFETPTKQLSALIPKQVSSQMILRGQDANAHDDLIKSLGLGTSIVNYSGHGSNNTWHSGLLSTS